MVMRRDRIFRRVLLEEGHTADLEMIHSAYLAVEPWWLSYYGAKVLTPEETAEAYRRLDEKVFSAVFPGADSSEALRVSRLVRKRWPELESEIPLALYPDAEPTLSMLAKDGYSMGLISNAPADTGKVVAKLGLEKYLDPVIISGVVGYSKPNPEIFRIALKAAGVHPQEAVHVGDLYDADVVGAMSAGVKGILIDRGDSYPNTDCPRIRSLLEVPRHL